MGGLDMAVQMSDEIKSLARKAQEALSPNQPAYRAAAKRLVCPIDYMRYAEFEAILRQLTINAQMSILDISSPQWFSLGLAHRFPQAAFVYVNIIDSELTPYRDIAAALGLTNLTYLKTDARNLPFANDRFDKIISISVMEHIYPEIDGDLVALLECKRLLKTDGELLLTVPCKAKANVVYVDRAVWERSETEKNFFAREYDEPSFQELVRKSDFAVTDHQLIREKEGLFAVDYHEWGPGRDAPLVPRLIKLRKRAERILGRSLDQRLAQKYLTVSKKGSGRLVNIAARLGKP